jgi:uncharacterized phiE125 gp8 family phage protein
MLIYLAPLSAPADAVAEVAAHLRLPFGFPDDAERRAALAGSTAAALRIVEARTGRALIRRACRARFEFWEGPRTQALPLAPVAALEALTLEDAEGLRTGVDLATIRLDAGGHPPRFVARAPSILPAIPLGGFAEVAFVAGYGSTLAEAPPELARAAVLIAAALHSGEPAASGALPPAALSLLEPWRTVRL